MHKFKKKELSCSSENQIKNENGSNSMISKFKRHFLFASCGDRSAVIAGSSCEQIANGQAVVAIRDHSMQF